MVELFVHDGTDHANFLTRIARVASSVSAIVDAADQNEQEKNHVYLV